MTTEAFFIPDGENRFIATQNTRGPWAPNAQHGGPPAALLGRAVEKLSGEGMLVARCTFDILRPVPIEPLEVEARVVRPGKKVQLIEASLSANGEQVMRVASWLIRTEALEFETPAIVDSPPPGPEEGEPMDAFKDWDHSYVKSMEWLFVEGAFFEHGPATTWFRMRMPLVEGEEPTPLQRVLCAADSASGISTAIDFNKWIYINTDLTVYLHRMPVGEWICIQARTVPERHGVGFTDSVIRDEGGPIGHTGQSLYIAPR
ncbi:MAG: hypothetical protein QOG54_1037 [Actinomycetota bacterium]|jgi:hypothetical protein|nr:hypothetical protein [Actinomycetota bacterium]